MLHHRRDMVRIIKKPVPEKFDIPLYIRNDGKYILHRIVAVKKDGYIVSGDNQCIREYPVMLSQILGVVVGFWRNGKYIDCNNCLYKLYCRLWNFSYPIRYILHIIKIIWSRFSHGG